MSDSRLNKTGLQYFYNRLKTVFASKSALESLEGRVDDIVTTGGEPNVIDSIKVNGTAQTVTNKTVDITVPTAVTDLSDAGDYATKNYVDTNGGKIDTISVNGSTQTITNKNVDITMPTKVSDLTNDSGFLAQETDPTVPAWAKAASKPSYTAQEVGALPSDTAIPSKTSDLTNDSGFQANVLEGIKVNGSAQTITGKNVDISVPTKVSDLSNDSGFQTAAQVQTAISSAVASAYKYKGSVATYSALPASPETGDVYDVQDTGMNYAWNGSAWDALGQLIDTSTLWTQTNLTAITTAEIDAIVV